MDHSTIPAPSLEESSGHCVDKEDSAQWLTSLRFRDAWLILEAQESEGSYRIRAFTLL
jgi:hypothetical protein